MFNPRAMLRLLLVLAGGVAIGYLIGSGASEDGSTPMVGSRIDEVRGETAPVLTGRQPELPPRVVRSPISRPGAKQESGATDRASYAQPTLEVRITDADGRSVPATVYAAPSGGARSPSVEPPFAYHEPPGPCRLRLPLPGTWDVLVVAQSHFGLARRTGVLVRAGETVPIGVALAPGRSIRIVRGDEWPIRELLRTGRLRASIMLRAVREEEMTRRGTIPLPWMGTSIQMRPPGGPWESPPLPPALKFKVMVTLSIPDEFRGDANEQPGYGVHATPDVVRPGATVRLTAERLATLHVRPRLETPGAWPEGPIRVDLTFTDGRGVHERRHRWRERRSVVRRRRPLVFCGRPGPARLAWDGPGITPGSIENLRLDAEEIAEAEMLLRLDAHELPSREPLVVHVTGLGGPPPHNTEDTLWAAGLLELDDQDRPTVLDWCGPPTDRIELDYGWRRATNLVVWRGTDQVSRPAPIPARGSMDVELKPAGMLVVVPCRLLPEGSGTLRVRRADGLPFLLFGAGSEARVTTHASVFPGWLLGPLPAGRHVFEVDLAGRRISDVTIDVQPHELGVLRLRW